MKSSSKLVVLILLVLIILVPSTMFISRLVRMSAGNESIRVFTSFDPFPITYTPMPMGADGPAGAVTITPKEEHVDIEGAGKTPTLRTETPTSPAIIIASPRSDVVCREGPSTSYHPVTYLPDDTSLPVDGRNHDNSWLRLLLAPGVNSCWVWKELLTVSGRLDDIPEIQPPPTPRITSSPQTGCFVIDPQHPNGYCRPGECTPNDQPGTICTLP